MTSTREIGGKRNTNLLRDRVFVDARSDTVVLIYRLSVAKDDWQMVINMIT